MRLLTTFFIFSFILLIVGTGLAKSEVVDFKIIPENPVKGDVVTIQGTASPNEDVRIDVSFEKVVTVQNGEYLFSVNGVKIPSGKNRFTVTAYGCDNLKVSVKIFFIWITLSSEANNGVATVSQSNVPSGTYDVTIHGKSGQSTVRLKIVATGYIKADENGKFSYSYETSSIPPGQFTVVAGGMSKTVTLYEVAPTPTYTPTSTPTSSPTSTPTQAPITNPQGTGGGGGGGSGGGSSVPSSSGNTSSSNPTPTSTETSKETPTPAVTPTQIPTTIPTITPTEIPTSAKLDNIEVTIEPKSVKAKPGDKLTYNITLNWEPKDWDGWMNISIVLSAAGFEKKFKLPSIPTKGLTPPLSRQISFEMPKNIPPMTYNVKVEVSADSINTSDKSSLSVSMPGFEVVLGILSIIVAIRLIKLRR